MSALRLEAVGRGTVPFQLLLYPLIHLDDGLWRREVFRSLRVVGRVAAGMISERLGAPTFPSLLGQDLSLSPPTFLVAGRHDPVRPDVEAYAAALGDVGVPVQAVIDAGLLHGSLNLTHLSGAARRALAEAGQGLGAAVRRRADAAPLAAGEMIL
jgi:acetyl esterase/lipase